MKDFELVEMRKIVKEIGRVLIRLIDANVNMEHYWFYKKKVTVPVEVKEQLHPGSLSGRNN